VFDITYMTLPYISGLRADVLEIQKGAPDWGSHVLNTYNTSHTACDCPMVEGDCIHMKIFTARLGGPEVAPPLADKIVNDFKKVLNTPLVLPVGSTRFKNSPIIRVEMLVTGNSDGVEMWSYYGKHLVRLVFAAENNVEKIMDRLNNKPIDFDDGQIIDF